MFYKYEFENKHVSTDHNIISFAVNSIKTAAMYFHSHLYTEVIVPINTKGKIITGINSYEIKFNTIYVIPPNISHTEIPTANSGFDYYTIKIKNVIAATNYDDVFLINVPSDRYSDMLTNLNLGSKYFRTSSSDEDLAILNVLCFYRSFTEILKEKKLSLQTATIQSSIPSYIIEIERFITQNCHLEINADDLAKQYGISRSTLDKNFKKAVGETLKDYVQNARLNTAVYLLKTSDMSITQIFTMSGYASASYFIRVFKKKYGVTPSSYRNNQKCE